MSDLYQNTIRVPTDCPDIILAVGPCRCATTIWLRAFGLCDILSYRQPIKSAVRWHMQGEPALFVIPDTEKTIMIKETLGPYTKEESTMNPLRMLIEAGVPAEKIKVFSLYREPLEMIHSWYENFSFGANRETLLTNAIQSYTTADTIYREAEALGIQRCSFVYESLKNNNSSEIINKVFCSLGVPINPRVLEDWDQYPPMGTPESRVLFPSEPAYYIAGRSFHEKVEQASSLTYYPKEPDLVKRSFSLTDFALLQQSDIAGIYDRHRRDCCTDLAIDIQSEWSQFPIEGQSLPGYRR